MINWIIKSSSAVVDTAILFKSQLKILLEEKSSLLL